MSGWFWVRSYKISKSMSVSTLLNKICGIVTKLSTSILITVTGTSHEKHVKS